MTKHDFILSYMEKTGVIREDALEIVNSVFEHVHDTLLTGNEVRIDGVGKLVLRYKAARTVQNNLLKTKHEVGPRVRIKFYAFPTMSRDLHEKLVEGAIHGN